MATTETPLSGAGEPLLAQAAVTNAMVDTNDALVPITENIALETLAIQIPASLVVASQENDNSNLFSAGVSMGGVDDNVMNLSMSQLNFMEAITAEDDHEASMDLSKAQQNFMESIAEMSQLMPEESIVATTALVAAAATTIVAEVVTEAGTAASLPTVEEVKAPPKEQVQASEQPLAYIIMRHPVWIAPGFPTVEEIDESIKYLDELIDALTKVNRELADEGTSPGFETKFSTKVWTSAAVRTAASSAASTTMTTPSATPYETLPSVNTSHTGKPAIPMPSPAATIKYYQGIRNTWVERRRYVESMGRDGNFCSCISKWDHAQGDVLAKLSNQSLEQAMVREASDAVTLRLQQRGFHMGMSDWDSQYAPSLCPTPSSVDDLYVKSTPIRVLKGRNDYISTMCALAMNAKSSIDVCTCYIFPHDPAQRYILLDLLPFVARYHGVTVRLLCDMMPVESSVVKSALRAKKKENKPKPPGAAVSRSGVAPTSFVGSLPPICPKFSDKAKASPESPMKFLEEVLDAAFSVPCGRFQIRWWCARDSQDKYRIKNHAKCLVFDGKNKGMALMGGSNIVPTVESGDSDLDMLVGGSKVVRKIGETFDYLWDSMDASTVISSTEIIEPQVTLDEEDDEASQAPKFPKQAWTDKACRAALVRSEPCSAGADVIFRHVLGAIASAEKSVYMCMGHSNKPMALASALGDAVKRGVRVCLLVNSIYSCDLRVNQRDLFRSLKNLLTVAPGVEVYTTALPSMKKIRRVEEEKKEEETDSSPPFLHSKYTVVDGKWVAVGSWNVWTRSAFYEIEHELLIHSEIIAKELETKFEREREATSVLLTSPEECDVFCPTGCPLCEPFGPFYM